MDLCHWKPNRGRIASLASPNPRTWAILKNIYLYIYFIFQKNEIVNILDSIFEGLDHDTIIICYEHVDKLVNKLI